MTVSTTNQERFLETIRQALGHGRDGTEIRREKLLSRPMPDTAVRILEMIRGRTQKDLHDLLQTLKEQAVRLNMKVLSVPDVRAAGVAIAEIVASTRPEWGDRKSVIRWSHPLLDQLNLESLLETQNVPITTTAIPAGVDIDLEKKEIRRRTVDAFIGVTSADFCLADTATLVLKTRKNQGRAVSLVPSMHVAVIRLDQILADLKELVTLLRWESGQLSEGLTHHMVLISGPSKTADIELVMVHGAHGPRDLVLVVVTEENPIG
jgi:L-lactate dehydrogenase complex protein LldG